MKSLLLTVMLLAWFTMAGGAVRTLEIWFIDVEGGQSTLMVTPAGESLLIDAGYSPDNRSGGGAAFPGGRDPSRVLAAIRAAGLSRIDYLLITHFHPDHAGGVPLVAAGVPFGTFIDYDTPLGTDRLTAAAYRDYEPIRAKGQHIVAHPGDRLPLKGLEATVVSAGGALMSTPLPGAGGANSACVDLEDHPEDGTENYRSVGVLFTFGAFRFLDLGDLSGNTLTKLGCPTNLVGPVSVYLIAHHGDYDTSIPSLYAALMPRVAIMNNGLTRGGHADAFTTVRNETSIEDLWQLHRSENERVVNGPDAFIANVDDGTQTSFSLRLSASDDGSFRVVNDRTGFTKTYSSRTTRGRSGS